MTSFESHLEYIRSVTSLKGHDVKDVKKLEPGDHLNVIIPHNKCRHHGVVYFVPDELKSDDEAYDQIQIVEMNRKDEDEDSYEGGIRKVSLHKFCYDRKSSPKYVVYGVSRWYKAITIPGTCHIENPLEPKLILERCDILLRELGHENKHKLDYSLLKANCEDFAIWCTLATTSAILSPQVVAVLNGVLTVSKHTTKTVTHVVHLLNHITSGVKQLGSTTTSQAAGTTAQVTGDTVKTVVSSGAKAASVGIAGAVGVGVELLLDTGRILRYKNDIEYTKDDLKMDIAKSGSTTAVVLGTTAAITFIASNPIGWAIGGGVAAGLICAGLWFLYKTKYGKSWKEKMYRQFADKNEFKTKEDLKNIKKLNKLRRKLNKYIRDFKLHPDRWSEKDIEEMKQHKEWLNDPTWYKRWWHKIQDNLSCTFKNQEELIKSYKTKKQKIKVFFLFQAIKEQIVKDIIDIKNGTYDEKNNKKNKKENKKPLAIELNVKN